MRALRSPAAALAAALTAALAVSSLTACVPSATPKTSDSLAPLQLPVPTLPVVTTLVPPAAQTTVLDAGSAVTLATIATKAPPPTSAAATTTSTTGPASTSNTAPNHTPGTYTVVAKDTLSGIARRCAVTPQAVADYNSWSDGIAHPIYPGTVVKLPCTPEGSGTGTTPTSTTTVKNSATTTTTPGPGGVYTVVAGDYLAGIAAKTGTTVKAIVEVNGWTDGAAHRIYPGDVIKLPAKK